MRAPRGKQRYSVNPLAFTAALILAPLVVTALSFWTIVGLFAPFFGAVPYLLIGTPLLLWAVGRVKPNFGNYAWLGFLANLIPLCVFGLMFLINFDPMRSAEQMIFLFGFGLIFGTLWVGTFGSLYAYFHPNIRILKS